MNKTADSVNFQELQMWRMLLNLAPRNSHYSVVTIAISLQSTVVHSILTDFSIGCNGVISLFQARASNTLAIFCDRIKKDGPSNYTSFVE